MHIYLSPHNDDVCFSLARHAARTGGELIVAFTASEYAPAAVNVPMCGAERIAAVTELRREEDMRFAAQAGLVRHDLGLAEPPVLGLDPFALKGLKDETDLLADALMPLLSRLLSNAPQDSRPAIYGPMGIGGHRNHVSLLSVFRRVADGLAESCDLFLYEDLHYASVPEARQRGIERALRIFDGFDGSPQVEELDEADAARKLEWIGLYASQHERAPAWSAFTPASGLSSRPHEILWRMSPHRRP